MATVSSRAGDSIWQTRPAVALGAFGAAIVAMALTRRHPRLAAEVLRATLAVGVIDIALSTASLVRGGALVGAGAFEGLGFLAAFAVVSLVRSSRDAGVD